MRGSTTAVGMHKLQATDNGLQTIAYGQHNKEGQFALNLEPSPAPPSPTQSSRVQTPCGKVLTSIYIIFVT